MKKYKLYILLFILLFVSYGYFFHWIGGWNESTRLDLTYSIVERHTFNIDPYHENTGDKAFFNSHYYCDKAPGLSFFAVPVYIVVKSAIKLFNFPISFDMPNSLTIFYLLTLFCVGVPSALLGVLFYKFIGYFTDNKVFQLVAALGYSLCTLAFPYSTLFIGHQFVAVLGFAAFFLAFRMKQVDSVNSKILFLTGLLAGYGAISEYPMGIVAAALFVYIFSFLKRKRDIVFFILGAVAPVLLLMYYNYACFGNPLHLSYKFEVPNKAFEGMKEGFFGITMPKLSNLYGILFGAYRGLFRTSPLLLLSIPGFFYLFKRKEARPEFYFASFVIAFFILLNSSYYMWYGGATMGPRHIIPILPFMSIGLVFFLENFKQNRPVKSIFKILFAISFLLMLFGTAVDPRIPPMDMSVVGFIFIRLFFGYHSLNMGILPFLYFPSYFLKTPYVLSLLPLIFFLVIIIYRFMTIEYSKHRGFHNAKDDKDKNNSCSSRI